MQVSAGNKEKGLIPKPGLYKRLAAAYHPYEKAQSVNGIGHTSIPLKMYGRERSLTVPDY